MKRCREKVCRIHDEWSQGAIVTEFSPTFQNNIPNVFHPHLAISLTQLFKILFKLYKISGAPL